MFALTSYRYISENVNMEPHLLLVDACKSRLNIVKYLACIQTCASDSLYYVRPDVLLLRICNDSVYAMPGFECQISTLERYVTQYRTF